MDKLSGVYQIKNIVNGKFYFGSSNDINERWSEHKKDLLLNKHNNKHLQKAYNKYGKDVFEYIIIKVCPPVKEILLFHEQLYLDYYYDGGILCYNILAYAGSVLGYKWTEEQKANRPPALGMKGKHHTEESKKKIAANRVYVSGEEHPSHGRSISEEQKALLSTIHTGKILTEEHKEILRQCHKNNKYSAKLTWEQVREIRAKYSTGTVRQVVLAKEYNISFQQISDIVNNKYWRE